MAEALLFETGVMFAAVAVVSLVAARFHLSPIPFYILAGIVASEFVAGRLGVGYVSLTSFVEVGAELGIVLLLLFLGLEFNLDRLLADRGRIGTVGLLDLGVNFTLGLGLGYVLFGDAVAAVVVAGIVYISSSAIITKTLLDTGWIANPESGPILGTLVFEDLAIAVYLAIVGAAVLEGGPIGAVAQSVGVAFGFLLALLVFVALGTQALEALLDTTSTEYFLLRALGVIVLIAGAALSLGVSEAVAAFFVGMAFSSTSVAHDLEDVLSPLRDTFAAVFFFWIGLRTDPTVLPAVFDLILLAVVVTLPAKILSGFFSGRQYGLTDRRSLRVGLAMVTRGEFSLIIAATALAGADGALSGTTAETLYAFTVGYVLVMSILGTTLMQASPVLERSLLART